MHLCHMLNIGDPGNFGVQMSWSTTAKSRMQVQQ